APPGVNPVVQLATGVTIGGGISSCIIGFELFGARRLLERGGHRLPLGAAVLLRTIVYGVVIMAALLIFPWVYSRGEPSPFRPRHGRRRSVLDRGNLCVCLVDVGCPTDWS